MKLRKAIGMVALAAFLSGPVLAVAGPFQDFERDVANAYAHYRAALFHTNTKDRSATDKAIAAFESGWSSIVARWRGAPPPQYVEDATFAATLDRVGKTTADARAQAGAGDLSAAHETLEAIRDVLADLRLRNGITSFSDQINAFHAHMEHLLATRFEPTAEGRIRMREDAAVLAFLARELEKKSPVALRADPAFRQSVDALNAAVVELLGALRAGDEGRIEAARKALKPVYAKLFVRYG